MNQDRNETKDEELRYPIEPREVPPGAVATARMDLAKLEVPEGQELVPVAVELDEGCAGDFEVLFASRGDEVLGRGPALPANSLLPGNSGGCPAIPSAGLIIGQSPLRFDVANAAPRGFVKGIIRGR